MIRRALLFTLFVSFVLGLGSSAWGQDDDKSQNEAPILFSQTLVQDISTAGFYDLISWLTSLKLSTRGNRDELVQRLYDHYQVPEDERVPDAGSAAVESPPLVIDSAERTQYFTMQDIDEKYVRLSGGVVLTLRDAERDVIHRIEADEVTFNPEQQTLSASGNVVYTLDRGTTVEQFFGTALTVEIENWEGAFVQGVSERERTVDGKQIDFSFAGSYITRSRDDIIVLEDGQVTSSKAIPPNYEIRASKIWVLAPGEWGLSNATLYVGRIPVFYFPFFFRPGNELFFNPAVGSNDRSGIYLQTTTYLRGSPDPQDSPFSLLQLADDLNKPGDRQREGLYLVPRTNDDGSAAATESQDGVVRLLLDVYTKLGIYAGYDAELPTVGAFSGVKLYAAVALSRNLYRYGYPGQGITYSPYYFEDGLPKQSVNMTTLGSVRFPIRYGFQAKGTFQKETVSASVDIASYSDSRFQSDFGGRSEQIDWLGLLGQGSGTTSPGGITSLLWAIRGSYRPSVEKLKPFVQQFSIQNAVLALQWRSKAIPAADLPYAVAQADQSPEASFFYPESMKFPELGLSISGVLLEIPGSRKQDPQADGGENPLIPPWGGD
ncbi:MAG: hypothetical protein E4H09_04310, partial [Spirochaetales bacterium]